MTDDQKEDAQKLPPYISFQTFKTLLEKLKRDGLPHQIDRSILTSFSGSVANQIIPSLKFLGLTTQEGVPTDSFKNLLEAFGSDKWAGQLQEVIRGAYDPLFVALPLGKATAAQFNSQFKDIFQVKDSVLKKCIPFFLNASKDAEIEISPYVTNGKRARVTSSKPRKIKVKPVPKGKSLDQEFSPPARNDAPVIQTEHKPPSVVLLSLYVDDMEDDDKAAVWRLIQFYKSNGDKWPS